MTNSGDDIDPIETKEWLDAFASLVKQEGAERVRFIIDKLLEKAAQKGVSTAGAALTTPYMNTIPPAAQPAYPGDLALEQRIDAINRWNAIANGSARQT